jgi:hypothetical protein
MKRHRQANPAPAEPTGRHAKTSLHAAGVWAKPAAGSPASGQVQLDLDGQVWTTRYIDSRLKQFGSR